MLTFWRNKVLDKAKSLLACLIIVFVYSVSVSPVLANTTQGKRTIPFERLQNGQYTIEVTINGVGPLKLMIDTAASRTSLFEKTRARLDLKVVDGAQKYINGMISSGYRPTANVDRLSFGRINFRGHNIIILEDWDEGLQEGLDGILGMDVLDGLVLTFSHKSSSVKISKYGKSSKVKYHRWKKIRLRDNPYPVQKYGLVYTYTRLGDLHIPTLLDTGSNFSAINWKSIQGTDIEMQRKRLRKKWVVQGSIGEFKPRLLVRLDKTNIGGIKFKNHEFLVMYFDNFPINNYGKYPLVIAGIDLMDGKDFVLDFANNYLFIKPNHKNKK